MPYRWTTSGKKTRLHLWPHQSLTPEGYVWFIGATAAMLALPLLAVLGSPVVWVLLGFFVLVVAGMMRAIAVNRRRLKMNEELEFTSDKLTLVHTSSEGERKEWEANPHWVRIRLRDDGPVEHYLTLGSQGREVEVGRFLAPEERESLYDEISDVVRAA